MAKDLKCGKRSFLEAITSDISPGLKKLTEIWHTLYGSEVEIEMRRQETVREHFKSLINGMIEEEEENKDKTIERIEGLMDERSTLEKELHIEIKSDIQESEPLIAIEAGLHEALEAYRVIKRKRLEKLCDYQDKEKQLCLRLGLEPEYNDFPGVPSEDDLLECGKYLIKLEEEEFSRENIFNDKKEEITALFERLELKPTLSFETAVLKESSKEFKLNDENMKRIEDLLKSLKKQEERAQAEVDELLGKLSLLWERLKEDSIYREQFLISHTGIGKTTINGLKEELQRCEELKRKHVEKYIKEIRTELESWWERLCYSEEQKAQFRPFYMRDYTEELLELHECEVNRLKKFYEENRDIFYLNEVRNNLWNKMKELNDKSKDRLFKNRGGQLLKEEKERKEISRNLPKIEKELKLHLVKFEEVNGYPFSIEGVPLLELIDDQWKENSANKVAQKQARKVNNTTTLIKTPSSGTKRKLVQTPSSTNINVTKVRKLAAEKMAPQYLPKPKEKKPGYNFQNPASTCKSYYNFRNQSGSVNTSTSSVASYTLFQEQLEGKNKSRVMPCRSSTTTKLILKESNATTPIRSTPLKSTPIKTSILRTPRSASSKIPTPNRNTGPRLTTARGKLPIII